MAMRRKTRTLMDSYKKAKAVGTKPPNVSLIIGGVKHKAGQDPVRVCPAGVVSALQTIAQPV